MKPRKEIARYYDGKVRDFGATPQGVDWNSADGQDCRFAQLLRIAENVAEIDLLDVGCGYGALVNFLSKDGRAFAYHGIDISSEMIEAARDLHHGRQNVRFSRSGPSEAPAADFALASGIFNVRLSTNDADWKRYIEQTLEEMHGVARRGFAFNILTSYSDREKQKDYLYYADPAHWLNFCHRNFSRNVAVLHDYGLYEFTVLVRKDIAP